MIKATEAIQDLQSTSFIRKSHQAPPEKPPIINTINGKIRLWRVFLGKTSGPPKKRIGVGHEHESQRLRALDFRRSDRASVRTPSAVR